MNGEREREKNQHKAVHVAHSLHRSLARPLHHFSPSANAFSKCEWRIGTRSIQWIQQPTPSPLPSPMNCCRIVVHSLHWIRRCASDRKRKSMQATWKLNIIWNYIFFFFVLALYFLANHSMYFIMRATTMVLWRRYGFESRTCKPNSIMRVRLRGFWFGTF